MCYSLPSNGGVPPIEQISLEKDFFYSLQSYENDFVVQQT